jgi:hypothetical protein
MHKKKKGGWGAGWALGGWEVSVKKEWEKWVIIKRWEKGDGAPPAGLQPWAPQQPWIRVRHAFAVRAACVPQSVAINKTKWKTWTIIMMRRRRRRRSCWSKKKKKKIWSNLLIIHHLFRLFYFMGVGWRSWRRRKGVPRIIFANGSSQRVACAPRLDRFSSSRIGGGCRGRTQRIFSVPSTVTSTTTTAAAVAAGVGVSIAAVAASRRSASPKKDEDKPAPLSKVHRMLSAPVHVRCDHVLLKGGHGRMKEIK